MSSKNGIFDEIAYRKPRRVVTIRYIPEAPAIFAVAGCFGFLILLVVIATVSEWGGCGGGSCGSCGKDNNVDRQATTVSGAASVGGEQQRERRFFAEDLPPSRSMLHHVDEIKRAIRSVHNNVRDVETRLARDEQMLLNTSTNVARLNELRHVGSGEGNARKDEAPFVAGDHLEFLKRGDEAVGEHVAQLDASERMLADLTAAVAETEE